MKNEYCHPQGAISDLNITLKKEETTRIQKVFREKSKEQNLIVEKRKRNTQRESSFILIIFCVSFSLCFKCKTSSIFLN